MALDPATETARIDAAQKQLAHTVATYEEARRDLLASDGKTPIYPEPEHAKRLARLRETFADRVASVDAVADAVLAGVERARLSEHADPLMALNLAELNLAGAFAPFVREDVATLPLAALVGRLEWAAASKDAGLRFCYARYGLARFQSMLASTPQPDGLPELRQALTQLGAIGASRGLSSEAEALRYAAVALKRATAGALAGNTRPALGAQIAF